MQKFMKIYILGSKGIPASYGGFETLAEYLSINQIKYVTKTINEFYEKK